MRISIIDNQTDVKVGFAIKRLIRRAIKATLEAEGRTDGDVTVLLCGGDEIRLLNKTYRQVDSETDVLSFPMDDESAHIGDMAIYMKRAMEQGEEYGHGIRRECAYLASHSALHLVGYDHEDEGERAIMRQKEDAAMERIGLSLK